MTTEPQGEFVTITLGLKSKTFLHSERQSPRATELSILLDAPGKDHPNQYIIVTGPAGVASGSTCGTIN